MTTTTTRKQPQDRRPKKEEIEQESIRFEDLPGAEHVISFDELGPAEQTRLIGRVKALGLMPDEDDAIESINLNDVDFEALADLIDYFIEKFAADKTALENALSGKGGMTRAMELIFSFINLVGE